MNKTKYLEDVWKEEDKKYSYFKIIFGILAWFLTLWFLGLGIVLGAFVFGESDGTDALSNHYRTVINFVIDLVE